MLTRVVLLLCLLILALVSASCTKDVVLVDRCQYVPTQTQLRTVRDYYLRAVELDTYLKECTK